MPVRFIYEESELVQLLEQPYAKIIVLKNGQMTLSTVDCRIDILLVYQMVHHKQLRITSPVTIELSDSSQAL